MLLIIYQQVNTISHQLIRTMRQLPSSIQRICNVQFFAWIGWFPFLFYSTTWVAELANSSSGSASSLALQDAQHNQDTVGESARAGSFAFLLHSIVSLVTACLLPVTVAIGPHPSKLTTVASTDYTTRLGFGRSFLSFSRWLTLHRVYTLAHIIFGTAMLATIFASAVWYATILIAICGISWAIMMWAPFALIGEIVNSTADDSTRANLTINDLDSNDEDEVEESTISTHPTTTHIPSLTNGGQKAEYHPLTDTTHTTAPSNHHDNDTTNEHRVVGISSNHHESNSDMIEDDDFIGPMIDGRRLSDCAGEILGIHNIYVVIPQFVSTCVSSILFALFDHYTTSNTQRDIAFTTDNDEASSSSSPHSPIAIGWILRLGGISVLFAAYLSTKIRSA
jgi:solute carrier family 45 protein 1/2/4